MEQIHLLRTSFIQHPVPDDCGEYTVMGVVPEEAEEYMVTTAADGGKIVKE